MPTQTKILERLCRQTSKQRCGGIIASQDPLHRTALVTDLLFKRFERKLAAIDEFYAQSGQNWNWVLYMLLFGYMGDPKNKLAYLELARRTNYERVIKERRKQSLLLLEAMLLGGSGWLQDSLRAEFDYLQGKYAIEPMNAQQWRLNMNHPANHPAWRLAQIAKFLFDNEFVFQQLIDCRTAEDVHRIFSVVGTAYWWHGGGTPCGLSSMKTNVLGINVVVPLQRAYGIYTQNDELCDRAIQLLENIPAESNFIIREWTGYGLTARNAFDTQAILQLNNEFCEKERCRCCPVLRPIAEKIMRESPSSLESFVSLDD